MTPRRLWIYRAVLAAFCACTSALAVFLALVLWDACRAQWPPFSPRAFALSGGRYYSVGPSLPRQSFAAKKAENEFRVFVVGSSEAMGTPYVSQRMNFLTGRLLGMQNEGGIPTWLAMYLRRLLPRSKVTVVNTAGGAYTLANSVSTMEQVLEVGQPDAIIMLEGNNEGGRDRAALSRLPTAGVLAAIDRLSRDFDRGLARAAGLARDHRVPLYVLTVPNNLRDWLPQGPLGGLDPEAILARLDHGEAPRVLRELRARRPPPGAVVPMYWALLGRAQEGVGDYAAARASYLKAKDLDHEFNRTRSRWNDAIRDLHGPFVRVVDLERLMFRYAKHGIPGNDLFVDYCHMRLPAYRLAAFELARRLQKDYGWTGRSIALQDADLKLFTARQLRGLYRIKRLKWARAAWLSARGRVAALNDEKTARAFADDMAQLDGEIGWFEDLSTDQWTWNPSRGYGAQSGH